MDEDDTPEVNKEQEKRNRDYLTTSSNRNKSNKKNKGRQQTQDGASRIRESTSPPTPTTREEHEDLNEEESDDTRQQDEEEDPHDTDNTTDENETRIRHQQAGINAFQHHQQERASTVGENALKGMIRNVVRHQLFRAFKFIKEDDLAYDGTISKYILKRIGRQSSLSNPTFWSRHRGLVKKAIDSKRSTTAMAIKKEVISK